MLFRSVYCYGYGVGPGIPVVWDRVKGWSVTVYRGGKMRISKEIRAFFVEEDGVGVIEIVLILVDILTI